MNAEDMTVHVEVLQETQGKKNGLLDLYVPPALLYVDSLVAMFCPTSEILFMQMVHDCSWHFHVQFLSSIFRHGKKVKSV